jgi:[acyl-carrier-protein] S-malonyltransferase
MSLAFVFPGQGSQSVGMLAELAGQHSEVEQTFRAAGKALDLDLWSLVQNGPEAELNRTQNTQPAMLAAGVAVWEVWHKCGGSRPALLAGHSLGEYTALVCAGALAFEDAVHLVAERGRLMQEAVPEGAGAMAAILGLDDERVRAVCREAARGDTVSAANLNAPGQVVIAGAAAAVERAIELARTAGAKRAMRLPVSVPSHCELMRPAAERLARRLEEVALRAPALPVIQNAGVTAHAEPEAIRRELVRQLYCPVRWVETVQALAQAGVHRSVECGPGKVLVGLNKRIAKEMTSLPVFDTASLQEALAACEGE